jgi:hypothetical protein
MNEYNFDEFEEGPVEAPWKRVSVTISSRGHFYLNRKAIEAMGEPDAVVLFFDRERKTIGMQRSPIGRKNAFQLVRRTPKENGRMVFATNFFRRHNVTPTATIRIDSPQVNKDGILILDLNNATPVNAKEK